ncbi:hypothetical protein AB0J21_07765 [Streptomyces sp. NPDC049954]|uniref:hypothetical protein n=1 Tax=Streptomyces sp. NPDC049954 TaxID=3155779 RepID=UPI003415DEC9
MKPRQTECVWCKSVEPHVPLTEAQKQWLRGRIEETYVENYLMCAAGTCRKVRTSANKWRFRDPVRIPEDVN